MQPENRSLRYAAAFAPGLIDPAIAAPEDLVAAAGKRVVKRYNVYRNNVTVSLIDALAAVYPAVQRITGVDFFRAMARFHKESTPVAAYTQRIRPVWFNECPVIASVASVRHASRARPAA